MSRQVRPKLASRAQIDNFHDMNVHHIPRKHFGIIINMMLMNIASKDVSVAVPVLFIFYFIYMVKLSR